VTFAGTGLFDESIITIVLELMVETVIGSLNVTVGDIPKLAPVLPFVGVTDVTVGGVVELEGINTTSTQ
jgi:hypothetical protein